MKEVYAKKVGYDDLSGFLRFTVCFTVFNLIIYILWLIYILI